VCGKWSLNAIMVKEGREEQIKGRKNGKKERRGRVGALGETHKSGDDRCIMIIN